MQNLFEGGAKHFAKLILNNNIMVSMLVLKRSNAIVSPMKIGHLTMEIESNYSGYTADQWFHIQSNSLKRCNSFHTLQHLVKLCSRLSLAVLKSCEEANG